MRQQSVCPLCGDPITEDEYAIPNADGEQSHEACVQDAEADE